MPEEEMKKRRKNIGAPEPIHTGELRWQRALWQAGGIKGGLLQTIEPYFSPQGKSKLCHKRN